MEFESKVPEHYKHEKSISQLNINKIDLLMIGVSSFIIGRLVMNFLTPKEQLPIQSSNVLSLETRILDLETRLQEQQIYQIQQNSQISQQPQIQHTSTESNSQLSQFGQIPSHIQQQNQKSQQNTLYKNNESWEIKRGTDGFISNLNVLRDVKTNN